MTHAASEIEAGALIDRLKEGKVSVTRHQLVRWHKRGLLPRPRVNRKGYGKGTETVYPMIALGQAFAIAQLRRLFPRDLDSIGWGLWCLGFPVEPFIRRRLVDELGRWRTRLADGYQAFLNGSETSDFISGLTVGRFPRGLGAVRRRVGKNRMDTVVRMAAEVLLGERGDTAGYDPGDFDLVRQAVDAQLGGIDSVPADAVEQALTLLSTELNIDAVVAALERTPDDVLRWRRNEAQTLFRVAIEDPQAFVPTPLFLLWFAMRESSPTIDTHLRKTDMQARPTLQLTMVEQLDLQRARGAGDAQGD